jgi:hypothetical protein
VIGAAVEASTTLVGFGVQIEPELGGDDDVTLERCECFADQFLVGVEAVDLGGVEERYETVDPR